MFFLFSSGPIFFHSRSDWVFRMLRVETCDFSSGRKKGSHSNLSFGGFHFWRLQLTEKGLTRKTCLTWEVCFNVKWVSSLTIILWLPFSEQQWNIRQNYIVDAYKCTSYIGKGGFPTNFDFVGIRDKYFTICWCTIVWLGVLLFKDIRLTSWNGKKYNNVLEAVFVPMLQDFFHQESSFS